MSKTNKSVDEISSEETSYILAFNPDDITKCITVDDKNITNNYIIVIGDWGAGDDDGMADTQKTIAYKMKSYVEYMINLGIIIGLDLKTKTCLKMSGIIIGHKSEKRFNKICLGKCNGKS